MEEIAIKVATEFVKERERFFRRAEHKIKTLTKKAKSLFPDAKVFIFGSFAKNSYDIYLSDIDVLIVSKTIENKSMLERAELVAKLREGIEGGYIFQIHLVTPKEFEMYKKFIDVMKEVEF